MAGVGTGMGTAAGASCFGTSTGLGGAGAGLPPPPPPRPSSGTNAASLNSIGSDFSMTLGATVNAKTRVAKRPAYTRTVAPAGPPHLRLSVSPNFESAASQPLETTPALPAPVPETTWRSGLEPGWTVFSVAIG